MDTEQRYADLVRRLRHWDYTVIPDGEGYVVQHLIDTTNVSLMRHLDDLVDFAELIEWAAAYRTARPAADSNDGIAP